MTGWKVQGMGRGKVPADWPPLDAGEAGAVLRDVAGLAGPVSVRWASPRPMSAAAVVIAGDRTVFIKRHHRSVRSPAALREEHDFAAHLCREGMAVPALLTTSTGASVIERGEWVYEVQDLAGGVDTYRDVQSWEPYRCTRHAAAAGATLARFHEAAASYPAPVRAPSVLSSSQFVAASGDPVAAIEELVASRPALARALVRRSWRRDVSSALGPGVAAAAAHLAGVASQWGHGDWHPSNLLWSEDGREVVAVIDLGLANRTSAVHDLAVALERSVIGWLDLEEAGSAAVDTPAAAALLSAYQSVRPLAGVEIAALVALLPVVHVDFALSEVEYFASVVNSPANAELAYRGYLLGHAEWFAASPAARSLLEQIGSVASGWGGSGQ